MTEYMISATFPAEDSPTNQVHLAVDANTTAEALSTFFSQFSQMDMQIADNAEVNVEIESD